MKKMLLSICLSALTLFTAQAQNQELSAAWLKDYLNSVDFSGTVLLKKKDGEILQQSNGYSDLEESQAIAADSKFRICSITKLFTATLIMQLVDEEKLSLKTTLASYPEYGQIPYASEITIKNLLQHTSGLKNEKVASYLKAHSPDALISKFAYQKGEAPGKVFNYNNIDFLLLGRIIELVTEKSYEINLKERILNPLGMDNSGLITGEASNAELVPGFVLRKDKRRPEQQIHLENFWAAGSMYSTTADLLKFTEGLKSGDLLSENSGSALLQSDASLGYAALGCWTFNSPFIEGSPRVMERRGEILSVKTVIMTSLDGPETVIMLANTNGFDPSSFGDQNNPKEFLFKTLFQTEQ